MNSMTGFGRAEVKSKIGRITVEASSINNRFLEYAIRLPRPYMSLEPLIREFLADLVSRGKITVNVTVDESSGGAGQYTINEEAIKAYNTQLKGLQKKLKTKNNITLRDLLLLPEAVSAATTEIDLERVWKTLKPALGQAVTRMVRMRKREGTAMGRDMRHRLKNLTQLNKGIRHKTANSVELYSDKLKARIQELLQGTIDESPRLEEEIALFADRTDITEETVRLDSHITQFAATIRAKDPAGRRLNFILQEMNREVNTIGSKCSDFSISSDVIALKEEVEKLREMVQNVE
ncbi:MAG: YicC family protein [Candidatus Zixiibacteriota bacterium]|nr:MAG: YicC family protein [candidate division Zixibacteria bacterium]